MDGDFDLVTVRYTPRMADLVPSDATGAKFGAAAWSSYLAFDHAHPMLVARLRLSDAPRFAEDDSSCIVRDPAVDTNDGP